MPGSHLVPSRAGYLLIMSAAAALALGGCAGRHDEKVVVVGVDGATFDLVRPWVEQGRLPVLARLMAEGAHGVLASPVPPSSASAWTSATTGVNPGKHGIFGFMSAVEWGSNGEIRTTFATSRDRGAEPVWSIVGRSGKKAGLINIPLTSPPDSLAGFMISGFPLESPYDYAYPEDLKREILNYRLDRYGEHPAPGHEDEFLADLRDINERREATALRLLQGKDVDLFWVVFTMTDRVQHYFWKYMDPRHPQYDPAAPEAEREAIFQAYQQADQALGRILDHLGDRTLLVISDHGFGLNYQEVMGDVFLASLKQNGPVEVYATDNFGAKFSLRFRTPPPHSAADSAAYRATRDELVRSLRDLVDPQTGQHVLNQVWLRDELYRGPYVDRAPEVIGLERDEYLFVNWMTHADQTLIESRDPWFFSGFHRVQGILIARGPGVARGKVVTGAELMDITPTILALLGVALPDNLDGKVLEDLFVPEWAASHRTGTQPAVRITPRGGGRPGSAEEAEIERQLRSVGYLR